MTKDPKIINISSLKDLVCQECNPGSHLREVILLEPDELTLEEIVAKGPIWLKLLKLEKRR